MAAFLRAAGWKRAGRVSVFGIENDTWINPRTGYVAEIAAAFKTEQDWQSQLRRDRQ